mmetsp:Transcript_18424/g.26894  ORF Transcript_18424/g.26894 Transcript_18424/m.26894 type:complete len:182 (+) Transcript_18424:229-774(+)
MEYISDMQAGKDFSTLFVAGRMSIKTQFDSNKGQYVIVKMEDDTDTESEASSLKKRSLDEMKVFLDMTQFFKEGKSDVISSDAEQGIVMTVDSQGYLYATYPGGMVIVDQEGDLIANVSIDVDVKIDGIETSQADIVPKAIVIGNDGYLYIATKTMLLRWRVKSKALNHPTNLIVPKRKST